MDEAGIGIVFFGRLHDPGASFVDDDGFGFVGQDVDPANVLRVKLVNFVTFAK